MATPNDLKAALRRGEKQLGLWLSLNSLLATEMASGAGFDWVLIDMEHSVISEGEAVTHLRAARAGGAAEPLIRVPWNDPVVRRGQARHRIHEGLPVHARAGAYRRR